MGDTDQNASPGDDVPPVPHPDVSTPADNPPPQEEMEEAAAGDAPDGQAAGSSAAGGVDTASEYIRPDNAAATAESPADASAHPAEAPTAGEQENAIPDTNAANMNLGMGMNAETASVSFVIVPEDYGQTKEILLDLTMNALRASLEDELSLSENTLALQNLKGGSIDVKGTLDGSSTLRTFGVKAGDQVGMEIRIGYQDERKALGDSMIVRYSNAHGEIAQVEIAVEKFEGEKSFIGGFLDKRNGKEYHHAVTQTAKTPSTEEAKVQYSRETQTIEYRSKGSQSKREFGTQMTGNSIYVSDEMDKIMPVLVQPYFTSGDLEALRIEKAVLMQARVRGFLARKLARALRSERETLDDITDREADRKATESDLMRKREIHRRMHPRTFEDFEVLYRELEQWRVKETAAIKENASLTEEDRVEKFKHLLSTETKLLQTIGKLRIKASKENSDIKIKRQLEAMAQPKVWAQSDNDCTVVHTPFTTRAKELMDLYNGLSLPLLTVAERLDVLLHVKWTVKEFDCNLTRDIVSLIDREAEMLNRGRKQSSLAGLRKRLCNLFLTFVKTPDFNPEAKRFRLITRKPEDEDVLAPMSIAPLKSNPDAH